MRRYLFLGLSFFLSLFVFGQSQILEGYVKEGLESNLSLQQTEFELKKSQERLQQAKALYLPQLSFGASYTRAAGGRLIQFPIGDLLNPVYDALDEIQGADVFPTVENVDEQFLPNDFHDTRLRLIQPVFNTDIKYNKLAQESLLDLSTLSKEQLEIELANDIRQAYYQFIQANKAVSIYESALEVMNELVRVNQKLVENDKATYDAIFRAEAEQAQIQSTLISARKDRRVIQSYFNFLLNRDLLSEVVIDENLSDFETFESLDVLSQEAITNRKELRQLDALVSTNENLVKLAKGDAALPKVNLVLDGGFQGFSYSFDEDQDYVLAQLSLNWDIFQGGAKKSKIKESQFELSRVNAQKEQLKDQVELQVITAVSEYNAALESVEAAQAREISAQKSFNLIQKKYLENQVILIEYLEASNNYTTAQLSHSIAQFQALSKAAELNKIIAKK